MLDFLIRLLCGALLILMPQRKAPAMDPQLEDELLLLRHLHLDA